MKKHFRFLYIFGIISMLVVGCSNNDEKTAKDQEGNQTKTEQKDLESKDNNPDSSKTDQDDSDQSQKKDSESTSDQEKSDASNEADEKTSSDNGGGDKKKSSESSDEQKNEQTGGEETDMPKYSVSFKEGLVPQQRLVEVNLDTEQPENYYVAVDKQVLQYKKQVNLYVGLIDSTNEEEIKGSIRVFSKS